MNGTSGKDPNTVRTAWTDTRLDVVMLTAAMMDHRARAAYLGLIAEESPELAAEARRRIEAAEQLSESFLEVPAADRLGDAPGDAPNEGGAASGAALAPEDRYELFECLGEGGMGRVMLAYDRQLDRRVALKFLNQDDPVVLRLFLSEARAQARVRHPHVLDVYDSGELDGQPYLSMRLVSGSNLAELGPSLSLEHKVRLVAQAAEGLHAAHRAGLVHRDVKPSNILVEETPDGELRSQVADFGLAGEMSETESGEGGLIAGSPHYIAPERLDNRPSAVDRRSDVYSLGVTMYWLFTGTLPFADAAPGEVPDRIRAGAVPPPRQRDPSLPAEIEAIILRCTARDPEDRYPSARALARDLERFLDGEVVEAYAAGLAYRITRFVLRNRLLSTMALVSLTLLLAASVVTGLFALHADAARQRAEVRQAQSEEMIRFMVVDLHEKLDTLGRLDIMNEWAAAAMDYFVSVPEVELSEDELLWRSRMLYQIGEMRMKQGDLAGASVPLEQSLALAKRLSELQPDNRERLFELGQSHFWLGSVYWRQGDLAGARAQLEANRDVALALAGGEPDNLAWRRELGYAHSNLGMLSQAEGDFEAALIHFRAVLDIDRLMVEASGRSTDALFELAATHNLVGVVYQDLGRIPEARRHLEEELSIWLELREREPDTPRIRDFLGTSHSYMGIHLSILGEWPAAERHFARSHQIFSELLEHDPANTSWQFKLAWSHINLGRAALARGRPESAEDRFRAARRHMDELLTMDSAHAWRRSAAITDYHLALLRYQRGDNAADPGLQEAIDVLAQLADERPTDRAVHRWLSQSYLLQGALEISPSAAEAAFGRAAEVIEPFARGSGDARVLAPWTFALRCLGRHDAAGPLLEELNGRGYDEPGLASLCPDSTH